MKRWIAAVVLGVMAAGLSACGEDIIGPIPIKFDAEVRELQLPGPSAWVVDRMDDPSISYFPLNLPAQYQVEGVQLNLEALQVNDGTQVYNLDPIEILQIVEIGL